MLEVELLTVPEAADRCRVSAATIYRLARDPMFPALRVGTQIRIPVDRLDAYLQRDRQPAA